MKKLLVIALVLGITSLANAGIVLSIDGAAAPDEIIIGVGDTIIIDADLESTCLGYDMSFKLSNNLASLDSSGTTFPTVFDFAGAVVLADPQEVRVTASQFFTPAVSGPATLVDNIVLEALELGEVTLSLIANAGTTVDGVDLTPGTELDSVNIVIPEPITFVLLGLGGLFMRRRK